MKKGMEGGGDRGCRVEEEKETGRAQDKGLGDEGYGGRKGGEVEGMDGRIERKEDEWRMEGEEARGRVRKRHSVDCEG
jgi:hypothetical protein